MTVKITLACTECKQRNYNTTKNKKNNPRSSRDEEVLPFLQEAHRSSRNQVKRKAEHNGRQNREKAGLCGQS